MGSVCNMQKTKLMGILNVTPDSFYDQGEAFDTTKAIEKGLRMFDEGTDILDIGGESSRPGATPVSAEDEFLRVIPVISALKSKIKIPISIDTMKPQVAKLAIEAGASIINDVTGFMDIEMVELAKKTGIQIVVMHMRGNPLNMQNNLHYEGGIVDEILNFFKERIAFLTAKGIKKEQIILDPGIGFGKSVADNLKIIHNLSRFKELGFALLLGISRKSFMGKILNKTSSSLLPATLGLNSVAIMNAVDIIRVHDIKEHRMLIDLMHNYMEETK